MNVNKQYPLIDKFLNAKQDGSILRRTTAMEFIPADQVAAVDDRLIERLKRNAKRIKKDQNIPHMQALDVVAYENGYKDWKALMASRV